MSQGTFPTRHVLTLEQAGRRQSFQAEKEKCMHGSFYTLEKLEQSHIHKDTEKTQL